jgi:hypothetical protein
MFVVGKVRGWCRRCGYVWFPDIDDPQWRPDPVQMQQWQEERERHYQQQIMTAERALKLLEQERRWLEWHTSMDDHARIMWEEAGIPRDWQDYWQLGYVSDRVFEHGGELFSRPSMTIPKFDFGWRVRNIDFRLIDPPKGVGRYRPVADLPQVAYITTPDEKGLRDEVYVCEGSKKAMVVSIRTGGDAKQVIGLPSCSSWGGMEEKLKSCGRVWILPDPDALNWAYKLGKAIGKGARIVELPQKPDDAILKYGMTPDVFKQQLRQAVKAA